MQGSQSSSANVCCANEEQTPGTKYIKDIIEDLERYGPAGLIHVIVLTNMIGKPIKIWNHDGSLDRIIGEEKKGRPIDIEYYQTDSEQIGHWTLRHGKNPENINLDLNSCLFSVISSQTGQDPSKLRKQLIQKLRCNFEELAHLVDEIIRMKGRDEITLMIGGAKYKGCSHEHAREILNNSQGRISHNSVTPGHPRGHASSGCSDDICFSVEKYASSQKATKTGFLSRGHQDVVAHWALKSTKAQDDMKKLNKCNLKSIATFVFYSNLKELADECSSTVPKAKTYNKMSKEDCDKQCNEKKIAGVLLVMRHQQGEFCNSDADVFIQTFYPIIDKFKIIENIECETDPKEVKKCTEPKKAKKCTDSKDPEDVKDPKECTDVKDPKECTDVKDPKECTDVKDPKECTDDKDPKECTDVKDPEECTDDKNPEDVKDPKNVKIVKHSQDPKSSKLSKHKRFTS